MAEVGPPGWAPPTGPPVTADPAEVPPFGFSPAPGPGEPSPRPGRVRPWWGLGDVVLGVPLILVAAFLGSLLAIPFLSGDEVRDLFRGSASATTPLALLGCSLVAQQVAQAVWPLVVSRWKGRGPALDWRLRFTPLDLAIGFGTACIAFGAATVAGGVVSSLVGLADDSQADNTQFLRDAQGTPWFWVFIVGAVVGAPLSEELLFRGLVLRAVEKRAGRVAAVIGSTVLFTAAHFNGGGWDGTAVLFASIGMVGVVLAVVTLSVDRLWPAIIAHMVFNALGTAFALGLIGPFVL